MSVYPYFTKLYIIRNNYFLIITISTCNNCLVHERAKPEEAFVSFIQCQER